MTNAFGQEEVDALFERLGTKFSACTSLEYEVLGAEVLGDAAYTVRLEHVNATVDGVTSDYVLRATQIYRRKDGEWKVVHRHGSAPPS